ncbi:unnamed protein product [Amaranthus hypochondriacus]
MQKEESYTVATQAGGKSVADCNEEHSSTPPDPTYNYQHTNTSITGSLDYNILNNPSNTEPINNLILSRTGYQEQPNNTMNCVDRTLSFADVMQFADFGPKLALTHPQTNNNDHDEHNINGIDPVYFLKFPVLGSSSHNTAPYNHSGYNHQQENAGSVAGVSNNMSNSYTNPVQLEFLSNSHDDNLVGLSLEEKLEPISTGGGGGGGGVAEGINKSSGNTTKRKRPRTIKTNEEVESQRMTHIAVERNRRKQMNEHLRVLRSLMPSSYVQRGDQASIIGGAIEFVRELEQLLQCLESQKRRRLYGDQARPMVDSSPSSSAVLGLVQQTPPQFPPPPGNQYVHLQSDDDQLRLMDHQPNPTPGPGGLGLLQEETAESKSCIADVEVKVLGFDALIKILSRRRPGQLIKAIAALEDLHFSILHTNITTIEQTILYSFNVKVGNEARFTAEDIATSVQQIFTFIHANSNII